MEMYLKRMKDEWVALVEQTDPHIRRLASEIAIAHAHALSIEFYRIVLADPHAEEFLSNEQVERQLKSALEKWIVDVLSSEVDNIDELIKIQHTVAEVHARIGIPVELVEMGFRVLKKILYPIIIDSHHEATHKLLVYHFSINSIDLAMEVMSRAFSFSESTAAKEDENYRIFSLLENAEEVKERQIAALLSWEMDIIYKVLLDSDLGNSLPLSQADFGLWFNHKGRHYFSGIAEVGHISRLIQDFDGVFHHTSGTTKTLSNKASRVKFLLQIRNTVSQIIMNRPGFPGECFICELRLPDHRFRWKHNKLFLLLPEEYGPAFPAIVDCYTSPPTLVWPVPLLHGFSSSYGVLPPLCKDH